MWIVMVVILVSAAALVWFLFFQTYHLATVDQGRLYRAGNRGVRELNNAVRRVKPKTVISIVDDDEVADRRKPEFASEIEYLKRRGIALERVRVSLGGWPTTRDIRRFLEIVTDASRQPALVHCAQGVRRTGMFVAAYQMSILGWDKQTTRQRILAFGHSRRTVGDVERFIDAYDAESRTVADAVLKNSTVT